MKRKVKEPPQIFKLLNQIMENVPLGKYKYIKSFKHTGTGPN